MLLSRQALLGAHEGARSVQSSRLQQLVLLVDDASSAWGRRQQKTVRRPISFVPLGRSWSS
jgi:hypothetical protein